MSSSWQRELCLGWEQPLGRAGGSRATPTSCVGLWHCRAGLSWSQAMESSAGSVQVEYAKNSDLQLCFLQLFVPPSSWPVEGGFVSNKWTCSAQPRAVLTDSDATSPAWANISTSTHENTSNLSVMNPSWPLYWLPGKETLPSATPSPLSSLYMEGC